MYGLPSRDERRCPADGAQASLHQPDDAEPLRLLLVCPDCGRWRVLVGRRQEGGHRVAWRDEAALFSVRAATTDLPGSVPWPESA